ncbi:MAG TPA: hypothetical protein VK716_01900 [Terracidiphilus sp.]|nr:hypothetical protein [Terracidiphilus sp.]
MKQVRKAVELSTLDQSKTAAFHLKAELAPSLDRDKDSGRTGDVEIWWAAPHRWRREVRTSDFHQIQIVDGDRLWQKNEGDYFPEWLREISNALIRPVELTPDLTDRIRGAEVKHLMGNTYLSRALMSSNGDVQKSMGGGISFTDATGRLFTANGLGFGGWFRNYKDFHGRQVAQVVSAGSPEVTARIVLLEDLGQTPAAWFDASANGDDTKSIETEVLSENDLRKNLLPMEPISWPVLKDGPLEGALTTAVTIDRSGKVRQIESIVADNPGVNNVAQTQIAAMHFKPFVLNGIPVQVVSRVTLAFKSVRPPGVETVESAHTQFERARRAGFPAAGTRSPYILHAEFQTRGSAGAETTGHYQDTWISETQWRREATLDQSRLVRARNGDKLYRLAEGPEEKILAFVLMATEPIPAIDTFVESDWRTNPDIVDGVKTMRVLSGYESPDGKLDPEHARAFWFDPAGNLVKTFFSGIETDRLDFQDFEGVSVAHLINVFQGGKLAMRIQITGIGPVNAVPKDTFALKGHEWTPAFTSEVR